MITQALQWKHTTEAVQKTLAPNGTHSNVQGRIQDFEMEVDFCNNVREIKYLTIIPRAQMGY